jgi:integrating conjugative element protein (TIGR03765 family)
MTKAIFFIGLIFLSGGAGAAPQNWGVIGPTVAFDNPLKTQLESKRNYPKQVEPINYAEMVASSLPITPAIKQGTFKRFRSDLTKSVSQPICLVGSDQHSLAWLIENRQELSRYQTVCFVMSARTSEDLLKIKRAAAGLIFQPVSGEQIAKSFNVPAYPALIYKGWIVQ